MAVGVSANPRIWTVLDIIRTTEAFFRQRGIPGPRLDAELLLTVVLKCERVRLYTQFDRPLTSDEVAAYRELVRKRSLFVPVHYLVGEREFYSRMFSVSPDVLIPRPETEFLVETVLNLLKTAPKTPSNPLIADIGTGSGNIAVTLACELPQAEIHATDVSAAALEVARRNADALAAAPRIHFHEGDLLSPLPENLTGRFDFVVSNPPYVRDDEFAQLRPEVAQHEPRLALSGGPDGLKFYRRLVSEAPRWLRPGGWLIFEVGAGQAESVQNLLSSCGAMEAPSAIADYARIPRVVYASLKIPHV